MLNLTINETENEYEIIVISTSENIKDKSVIDLRKKLNLGRREELSNYYMTLAGDFKQEGELSIIGMMIDRAEVEYLNNKELYIYLYIKK